MHIIQLLISMPVKLIEGNYINYLFVAGSHEVSLLVSTTFKVPGVYTVHSVIALFANTCIYKCIPGEQCKCDTAGQSNTFKGRILFPMKTGPLKTFWTTCLL